MMQQKKIKVLIFSVTYFPFIGGAEVALSEIIQRLPHIEFSIITAKLSKKLLDLEKINKVNVYRVGTGNKLDKYLYPFRAFLFAKKLQQQQHYNLIWSMMATWAGIPALWFKLKFPQIKYLLTLQSGDSDLFIWLRTWFWYPFYRMIYRRADHVQVISNWLVQRARRYGYQGKISLIPNGVDLDKFKFLKPDINLRLKLKINQNDKIILTTSRLVNKNDIATLIKAFKILINNEYSTYLIIAGSGKLERKLKRLTRQLKLENKITFLGQLKHNELLPYYAIADIFVRSSLSEGQGISFLEAMAAGIPVIATSVGGIPDFIFDKQTGLFCQIKSAQNLAQQIKLLFEDKELYLTIQKNALQLIREKYDWQQISQHMNDLFNTLI